MLVLLPPSETKRDGGTGAALDLSSLAFPELSGARSVVLDAVERLSTDPDAARRVLGLGPRNGHEADRNAVLRSAATLPALARYTGVLYDALDVATIDDAGRDFAAAHVVVHSALFGLVASGDAIPAYRLSHDSRVPGAALKRVWRSPIARVLADCPGMIVDLRSEGYAELGLAPERPGSHFVRVVSIDASGRRRALNHFNKRAKGLFVRALLGDRPDITSVGELIDWAVTAGFDLTLTDRADGRTELELVG